MKQKNYLVKNLPAVQETPVQFLGWYNPLEKGQATHSGLENPRDCTAYAVTKSQTQLSDFHHLCHYTFICYPFPLCKQYLLLPCRAQREPGCFSCSLTSFFSSSFS